MSIYISSKEKWCCSSGWSFLLSEPTKLSLLASVFHRIDLVFVERAPSNSTESAEHKSLQIHATATGTILHHFCSRVRSTCCLISEESFCFEEALSSWIRSDQNRRNTHTRNVVMITDLTYSRSGLVCSFSKLKIMKWRLLLTETSML